MGYYSGAPHFNEILKLQVNNFFKVEDLVFPCVYAVDIFVLITDTDNFKFKIYTDSPIIKPIKYSHHKTNQKKLKICTNLLEKSPLMSSESIKLISLAHCWVIHPKQVVIRTDTFLYIKLLL